MLPTDISFLPLAWQVKYPFRPSRLGKSIYHYHLWKGGGSDS